MAQFLFKTDPAFRHDLYWSCFLVSFALSFFAAIASPLFFGFSVPIIGAVFLFLYRPFMGSWPKIESKTSLILPVLLLLLVSLLFASTLWSVDPGLSLDLAGKLALLFAGGLSLLIVAKNCPHKTWKKYYLLFPFAVLLAGFFAAFEIFLEFPFYRHIHGLNSYEVGANVMNRQIAVCLLALPVSIYLAWKSRSVLFSLFLVIAGISLFMISPAPILQAAMLVTVILSVGCLFFVEKLTIRGFFLLAGFLFLMMPWIAPTAFDLFANQFASLKLENWDFISRRIIEQPLTGFGLDATRAMSYDSDYIYSSAAKINHPHNAALQIWIEFGAIGSLFFLAFLSGFYLLLIRSPRAQRRLGFIALASAITLLLASWQIWSSWLIGFFFALAALIILAVKPNIDPVNS